MDKFNRAFINYTDIRNSTEQEAQDEVCRTYDRIELLERELDNKDFEKAAIEYEIKLLEKDAHLKICIAALKKLRDLTPFKTVSTRNKIAADALSKIGAGE